MSFFSVIYNEILVRPFFNILILFYNLTGDFGIAVVLLTILVRFILYPFSAKAMNSQKELARLSPQVQEIQRKHKGNQAEQSKALMELYRRHGVNPLGGCLPLLVQLPVFLALFGVLRQGLDPEQLSHLYSFVTRPVQILPFFLGIVDLQARSIWLAAVAGLLQLVQGRVMPNTASINGSQAKLMQMQMTYVLPVIIFVVSITLPAGIALYLAVSTAFGVIQQVISNRKRTMNQI